MILICRGANFSANKIGQVTVKEASSLTINGSSSVTGLTSQLTATATFTDGSSETVSPIWSITSGSSYATISGSGLLTILPGASSSQVTVMADYDGITKTKVISVTYNFSFTLDVDVSDFVNYNGIANSIQNDGMPGSSPNSNVYACIIPCQSTKSLTITYQNLVVNSVTYYPRFKIYGLKEQRYSTSNDKVYARMYRNGSAGSYTFNGHIFDGFGNSVTHIPTFPLEILKEYAADGSARTGNCPYLCIVVQFCDSNNNSLSQNNAGTLASHASDVHLTYSIS